MENRLNLEQLSQMFKLPTIQLAVQTTGSNAIQMQAQSDSIGGEHSQQDSPRASGKGKGFQQARSPRIAHGGTTHAQSPRARRVEQQSTTQQQQSQRVLPPGYKTREQIEKENAIAAAREAYLNNVQNSSSNNSAAKAQYELEQGYMSKHHIESIEHQIKKMQVDLQTNSTS